MYILMVGSNIQPFILIIGYKRNFYETTSSQKLKLFLGMDLLLDIVDNFLEDVDAICNVSRTLSVLSSEDDIDKVSQTRSYI